MSGVDLSETHNSGHSSHYCRIAANYDRFYDYHFRPLASFIMNQCGIEIKPTDLVLDIGGGSGAVAQLIHHRAGLEHPVLCVDPSKVMIEIAKGKQGVITLCATAEEFVSQHVESKQQYNLVMANMCYHHWTDPALVLARIGRYLADDGVCIITTHPPNNHTLPLFKAAHQNFDSYEEDWKAVFEHAEKNQFIVRKVEGIEYCEVEKSLWYEGLRSRFMSNLSQLSDEQIKKGIEELEMEFKNSETIQINLLYSAASYIAEAVKRYLFSKRKCTLAT